MQVATSVERIGTTSEPKSQAMAAVVELLELTATGRPERLDFQLDTLLNSPVRFAVRNLASTLDVPIEKVAVTIYRACNDLDQLNLMRRVWSDPSQMLQSPNVAALYHVCQARLGRTSGPKRGRLEITLRRLRKAYELLQRRQWIEDFIGRPLPKSPDSKAEPTA